MQHPAPAVIRYKDLAFRLIVCLIGAHIIMLTGEDITTLEAFTIRSYYPTLAINYAIALVLAWVVRRITIKLDRSFSWDTNLWLRFFLQLFFGLVLVSLLCFFLVFIYFRSFGMSIMQSNYPRYQFPLAMALLALLNAFYVIYYFYNRVRQLAQKVKPENGTFASYIEVVDGRQKISLALGEVAYIYLVEKGVLIRTFDKRDYLCEFNLDELENMLDPAVFFRINRRVIAQRSSCRAYQPLDYGKLEVTLLPVPLPNATVSQRKAGAFREWMK